MKKLLLLLLMAGSALGATTYTEWHVIPTGSNLNSGHTTDNAATYTGVGDSDGTSVFTPSDGSTPASTVTNGAWGSVYVTAGATVATYVGLITNVAAGVNGAVTFSQVAKAGTFPAASGGAHTITLKVGGAWSGPATTVGFPFAFASARLTNGPTLYPRVNIKGGTVYSITAAITHSVVGPITWQGYTNTLGDLGQAIFDGGTGSAYIMFTFSGANNDFADLTFRTNGASGSAAGITASGAFCTYNRCRFQGMRTDGVAASSNPNYFYECEFLTNNIANTANHGGVAAGSASTYVRCSFHDNIGNVNNGAYLTATSSFYNCLFYRNGFEGMLHNTATGVILENCDFYSNFDGFNCLRSDAVGIIIENCNFIKNTGCGITNPIANAMRNGVIRNCGFGVGTMANGNGDIVGGGGAQQVGNISYATGVTPWVDPDKGNFTINLATAINTGRGVFFQVNTNIFGYPDIGAVQATNAPSGGSGTVGYGFAQ